MDSVGEGEGGKIWENGIETCVISCMKRKKYIYINRLNSPIKDKKKEFLKSLLLKTKVF